MGHRVELGVQVSRGHGYGQVDGLRVMYQAGNAHYESLYAFTATLCDAAANDNPKSCSD